MPGTAKKTVGCCLIVDDDQFKTAHYYAESLRRERYEVQAATSERAAIRLLKEFAPGVVLLHFHEASARSIRFIRKVHRLHPEVCTVYYTAYHRDEVLLEATRAGAYAFLTKPFSMRELLRCVKDAMTEHEHRRNLVLSRAYVFVLMPFADGFNDIYRVGIKEPLEQLGVRCERVDEIQFTGNVMERVFESIRSARLIVADMTGRNPNVFYEVGYAHALGKRTVLLTQAADDIPFDLRGENHIVYAKGIVNLRDRLLTQVRTLLTEVSS